MDLAGYNASKGMKMDNHVLSWGCTHDRVTGGVCLIVNFGAHKQEQPVVAANIEAAVIETIKRKFGRNGLEVVITSCRPKTRGKEQRAVAKTAGGGKYWASGTNDVAAMLNACIAAAEAVIAESVT